MATRKGVIQIIRNNLDLSNGLRTFNRFIYYALEQILLRLSMERGEARETKGLKMEQTLNGFVHQWRVNKRSSRKPSENHPFSLPPHPILATRERK